MAQQLKWWNGDIAAMRFSEILNFSGVLFLPMCNSFPPIYGRINWVRGRLPPSIFDSYLISLPSSPFFLSLFHIILVLIVPLFIVLYIFHFMFVLLVKLSLFLPIYLFQIILFLLVHLFLFLIQIIQFI